MEITNTMKKAFLALIPVLSLAGCGESSLEVTYTSGALDVTRVAALGNSLTAGIQSSGWTKASLEASYANLIVKQLFGPDQLGDGALGELFVVPEISDPGALIPYRVAQNNDVGQYSDGTRVFRYTLAGGGVNLSGLTPQNYAYKESFNNLAVPGATARDMAAEVFGTTATYASPPFGNPLFSLVLRERGTALEQAKTLKPTFAIFWAGNNEVLSSALSGGVTATFPLEDNGTVKGFRSWHTQVMQELLSSGAKVVTATIPNVTVIPSVSKVGIVSSKNERSYIADLDGNAVFTDTLAFWGSDNGSVRKLRGTERVMMGWLGKEPELNSGVLYGLAEATPLPDNLWLSDDEINQLLSVISSFNTYIKTWESNPNVAVVDINALFSQLASNNGGTFTLDGQTFRVDLSLPNGGFFSLDGTHPADFGYKVLANAFIATINSTFKAQIQGVSLAQPAAKTVPQGSGIPTGIPAGEAAVQSLKIITGF